MTDCIWRNADHDILVTRADEPAMQAPDGRMYQKVEHAGRVSYVPVDELLSVEDAEKSLSPPAPRGPIEPATWVVASTPDATDNGALLFDGDWDEFPYLFYAIAPATGVTKVRRMLGKLSDEQWRLEDGSAGRYAPSLEPGDHLWLLGIRDQTIAERFRVEFCESN